MAKKGAPTRKASNPVCGFNVSGGSPHFPSEAAWEAQMTEEGAKKYITDHLRTQLAREVPVALRAFEEESKAISPATPSSGLRSAASLITT